jgi:hypothetical protein
MVGSRRPSTSPLCDDRPSLRLRPESAGRHGTVFPEAMTGLFETKGHGAGDLHPSRVPLVLKSDFARTRPS